MATKMASDEKKFMESQGAVEPEQKPLQKANLWVKKQIKSTCTLATVRNRIPIINFLRNYTLTSFQCDLIAGLTVGLTVIPQGIAYAEVAKLPLQFGLYTAFMGCFVYCILGSVPQVNIGPTAIIALLTAKAGGPEYAIALGFISGIVELLFVVLNLGFLIDFISVPVISGFSSAAALIISATQLKGLLGLKIQADNFVMIIVEIFQKITHVKIPDLVMGLCSLVILLALRKIGAKKWDDTQHPPSTCTKIGRKVLWLICTARNALVVLIAAVISYVMTVNGKDWFTLTGNITSGLPSFNPPPFSISGENGTVITYLNILENLEGSIVLIPLVSILEHMAIAKVFAHGKSVDAKQELLALGAANVLGSFVSAFPSTGSFSRTALNGSCGVKTPIGGLYTGALVLLALGYLAFSFRFIPKATLSAVIISAVVFMIEYEMVVHLWITKKMELFVMMVTFFSCLGLSAEYGILIGIGLSLVMLLYKAARPRIQVERTHAQQVEFIRIQPDQNLFFPAIEYLRFRIGKATKANNSIPIVFDASHISATDYTIAQGIKQILDEFKSRNQKILFTNLKKEVMDLLHRMEAKDLTHATNLEELESMVQEPNPKLQLTVINNSTWRPEVDLEFVAPGTELHTKIASDLEDGHIWPPQASDPETFQEDGNATIKVSNETEGNDAEFTAKLLTRFKDGDNQLTDDHSKASSSQESVALSQRTADSADDKIETTKI